MDKLIWAMIGLLLVISAGSYSFADNHGNDENHICFRQIDANHDDRVTPDELGKFYSEDKALFEKIDHDKDGSISHNEYEEYWYNQE